MRLYVDRHCTAADNMRRDELLHARAEPAVRLYGWAPEAVSLGNSQTAEDVDLDAARELGLDLVKRATGGGGILHNAREVTYAVVVPLDFAGLPRDLPTSFAYLGQGVVTALRQLGAPAELESLPDLTRDSLCYVRRQGTNVMVRGKKISGGAQRRSRSAVLQHGTVIVDRDELRLARVFRTDPEVVRSRVTSLGCEGIEVERGALIEALIAGFSACFGPLVPASWAEIEPPSTPDDSGNGAADPAFSSVNGAAD